MSAQSHSFRVGDIECTVLLDSATIMGKDRVVRGFPDATEAEYRQAYADIEASLDEADLSFNILLSKIGKETVLVDTGEGYRPNGGYLLDSMRLAGTVPEDITLVVITHSHGDHVLGLLSEDGEAAFPNATYVISKAEMAFWQSRLDSVAVVQRPIIDMMEAKGLRLIDMEQQIIPGLSAIPIPGHTPGQIALLFESQDQQLIHMADLLHIPIQFAHPEWSAAFDTDTGVSVPVRRNTLGRAADESLLTLFYHLTFPGLGHVRRTGNSFTWEALATRL